jgi:hypothetical protein
MFWFFHSTFTCGINIQLGTVSVQNLYSMSQMLFEDIEWVPGRSPNAWGGGGGGSNRVGMKKGNQRIRGFFLMGCSRELFTYVKFDYF